MILLWLKSSVEFEMLNNIYGNGLVKPKEDCVSTRTS